MEEPLPVLILAKENDPFAAALKAWLRQLPLREQNGETRPMAVVLSPHSFCAPPCPLREEDCLIFRGDSSAAAEFAATVPCRLLDYGFSLRDTMTFSSLTEKQAVVALQRPMRCATGEELEPMELTVRLTEKPEADVLLAAGAICLFYRCEEFFAVF